MRHDKNCGVEMTPRSVASQYRAGLIASHEARALFDTLEKRAAFDHDYSGDPAAYQWFDLKVSTVKRERKNVRL